MIHAYIISSISYFGAMVYSKSTFYKLVEMQEHFSDYLTWGGG